MMTAVREGVGRVEGREGDAGAEVIGGDHGLLVTTVTLRAGGAGLVVRRMDGRR